MNPENTIKLTPQREIVGFYILHEELYTLA